MVVPGQPQKYMEDYTHIHTIITTVEAIFSLTNALSCWTRRFTHCFPESTVTLDVESINARFIMLDDYFVQWLDSKVGTIFARVSCVYIMHDCVNSLQ